MTNIRYWILSICTLLFIVGLCNKIKKSSDNKHRNNIEYKEKDEIKINRLENYTTNIITITNHVSCNCRNQDKKPSKDIVGYACAVTWQQDNKTLLLVDACYSENKETAAEWVLTNTKKLHPNGTQWLSMASEFVIKAE